MPRGITSTKIAAAIASLPRNHPDLTPLQKHVLAFGRQDGKGNILFSKQTIQDTVAKHGEPNPALVGTLVFAFNSLVPKQCPFGTNVFSRPNDDFFGTKLHLGTFRIYNPDGSVNEQALVDYIDGNADQNGFVAQNPFLICLTNFTHIAPYDSETGRNPGFFCSGVRKTVDLISIKKAYEEIFKMLTCEWKASEPLVHKDLLKLFFTDTPLCLEAATALNLPVENEELDEEKTALISKAAKLS